MNDTPLIDVRNLSRWYGSLRAVNDVSFEVRRGEVLGFLGPNGAGKTTTMQMISGALAPGAGSIRVAGIDLLESPREAKTRIGFLPEHPPLYPEMSVAGYLGFCGRIRGLPRARIDAAVDEAMARCGLGDVARRLIGNLSKGYQQRVGIAQAIIHQPAVVILDEPTVGLDPIQIRDIRALIRELGNDHSVILSTHILPEVQAVCDRVQIIHQGTLVLNDTLANLTSGTSLRVRLRTPPDPDRLAALPGVAAVDPLDDGRFRLHTDDTDAATDALLREATGHGWGLAELMPEQRSLEEVFVQITCGDDAGEHGGATAGEAAA